MVWEGRYDTGRYYWCGIKVLLGNYKHYFDNNGGKRENGGSQSTLANKRVKILSDAHRISNNKQFIQV